MDSSAFSTNFFKSVSLDIISVNMFVIFQSSKSEIFNVWNLFSIPHFQVYWGEDNFHTA